MPIGPLRKVVLETTATRDKAEALLEALRRAKAESERQMRALRRDDKLREATGRSIYDNAIESTAEMIDTLTRCALDIERDLSEDDLASLTEQERRELEALDAEALSTEPREHGRDTRRRPDREPAHAAASQA